MNNLNNLTSNKDAIAAEMSDIDYSGSSIRPNFEADSLYNVLTANMHMPKEDINFSYSNITVEGLNGILTAMKELSEIKSLILAGNNLPREAGSLLAKFLIDSAGLEVLSCKDNQLGNVGLGSIGGAFVCDLLNTNVLNRRVSLLTLREIDISNNGIGDMGILALCRGLHQFAQNASESDAPASLRVLKINRNNIGDRGAVCLTQLLSNISSLPTKYVDAINGSDCIPHSVGMANKNNSGSVVKAPKYLNIQHLELSDNPIGPPGIAVLLSSLVGVKSYLKQLHLARCKHNADTLEILSRIACSATGEASTASIPRSVDADFTEESCNALFARADILNRERFGDRYTSRSDRAVDKTSYLSAGSETEAELGFLTVLFRSLADSLLMSGINGGIIPSALTGSDTGTEGRSPRSRPCLISRMSLGHALPNALRVRCIQPSDPLFDGRARDAWGAVDVLNHEHLARVLDLPQDFVLWLKSIRSPSTDQRVVISDIDSRSSLLSLSPSIASSLSPDRESLERSYILTPAHFTSPNMRPVGRKSSSEYHCSPSSTPSTPPTPVIPAMVACRAPAGSDTGEKDDSTAIIVGVGGNDDARGGDADCHSHVPSSEREGFSSSERRWKFNKLREAHSAAFQSLADEIERLMGPPLSVPVPAPSLIPTLAIATTTAAVAAQSSSSSSLTPSLASTLIQRLRKIDSGGDGGALVCGKDAAIKTDTAVSTIASPTPPLQQSSTLVAVGGNKVPTPVKSVSSVGSKPRIEATISREGFTKGSRHGYDFTHESASPSTSSSPTGRSAYMRNKQNDANRPAASTELSISVRDSVGALLALPSNTHEKNSSLSVRSGVLSASPTARVDSVPLSYVPSVSTTVSSMPVVVSAEYLAAQAHVVALDARLRDIEMRAMALSLHTHSITAAHATVQKPLATNPSAPTPANTSEIKRLGGDNYHQRSGAHDLLKRSTSRQPLKTGVESSQSQATVAAASTSALEARLLEAERALAAMKMQLNEQQQRGEGRSSNSRGDSEQQLLDLMRRVDSLESSMEKEGQRSLQLLDNIIRRQKTDKALEVIKNNSNNNNNHDNPAFAANHLLPSNAYGGATTAQVADDCLSSASTITDASPGRGLGPKLKPNPGLGQGLGAKRSREFLELQQRLRRHEQELSSLRRYKNDKIRGRAGDAGAVVSHLALPSSSPAPLPQSFFLVRSASTPSRCRIGGPAPAPAPVTPTTTSRHSSAPARNKRS